MGKQLLTPSASKEIRVKQDLAQFDGDLDEDKDKDISVNESHHQLMEDI